MAAAVLDDKKMLKLRETDHHRKGGRGRERARCITVASTNSAGRSFPRLASFQRYGKMDGGREDDVG